MNNLNAVPFYFETWAKNRRKIIGNLSKSIKNIENIHSNCFKSIIIFSSLSLMASVASFSVNFINKSLSTKIYVVALTIGSLSFLSNVTDVYTIKTKVVEIEELYEEDKFTLDDLERKIQVVELNNSLQEFYKIKYEHSSEKKNILSKLKSFLKLEKFIISSISIAIVRLSHKTLFNTVALSLVNCFIIYDTYHDFLKKPKEFLTFKRLEYILRVEYDEMKKMYETLFVNE